MLKLDSPSLEKTNQNVKPMFFRRKTESEEEDDDYYVDEVDEEEEDEVDGGWCTGINDYMIK